MTRRNFLHSATGGLGFLLRRPASAPLFDGRTGYVEIRDSPDFSQPRRGGLTLEAWMRPSSLAMPRTEGSGYVHWIGKGEPHQHEWTARMYQQGNREARANRISFYAFNLFGGLGAGSYFQDAIDESGVWLHVAGCIDLSSTAILRDGAERDRDPLAGYAITPRDGAAPVRIGTRDLQSYFQGSICRVAIYGGSLTARVLESHYHARASAAYDSLVLADPSLVGYWKLDETTGRTAADATGRNHGTYIGGIQLAAVTWNPA